MKLLLLIAILVVLGVWGMVTQPIISRAGEGALKISPQELERHVRFLSVESIPRDHLHPDNLDKVATYIAHEFERSGATVTTQPFQAGSNTYRNVSALFSSESDERIVIGAHYDAAGPFPAADDNASGVAGAIALAQLLKGERPATTVEIVAYTLEEPPYFGTGSMGSAVHARSLRDQKVKVKLMISLEMIGFFSDKEGSQQYPAPGMNKLYPSVGNFIGIVGTLGTVAAVRTMKGAMVAASDLPVYSMNAPDIIPGVHLSDHISYWKEEFDAVMITNTAYFRNPNYHTEYDRPETLDYLRMAKVVQGTHAAVLALGR